MELKIEPSERGQGMVEYAFIMLLVALAVIVMLSFFGTSVGNLFSSVVSSF